MVTGATVEQDPTGLWWTCSDDGTTTGPYLDEVQATRALLRGPDTSSAAALQCALQTTAPARSTDNETEGRDGSR